MKLRPYFTMELVQKLMKKTLKYLFYSPLTEKVLTECPCIIAGDGPVTPDGRDMMMDGLLS